MALRHITCTIFAFISALCAFGQTTETMLSETDSLLNRYELICKDCIDMKTMVSSGKKVSKKDAVKKIDIFLEFNSLIRSRYNSLSSAQHLRFDAINKWFSTGTKPMVLDHEQLEAVETLDLYEPKLQAFENFNPASRSRKNFSNEVVSSAKKIKTIIMTCISLPEVSYGAMLGLQWGKWGGYMKLRSNFISQAHSYSCLSNGTIDSASPFWSNGVSSKNILSISGGFYYGITEWLNLYVGSGYGQSILCWQDIDNNWALVQDYSHKGALLDFGLTAEWKILTVGAGISSINLRTTSCDLMLGVCF